MSMPKNDVTAWADTLASGEPVTFGFSRVRAVLLAAVCLLFALIGLVVGIAGSGFPMILGWLAVLAFLLLVVVHLRRAFTSNPGLTIAPEGLSMTTSWAGVLPWSEILSAQEVTENSNKQIELELTRAEAERQLSANFYILTREQENGAEKRVLWLPAGLAVSKPALTSWINKELTARRLV